MSSSTRGIILACCTVLVLMGCTTVSLTPDPGQPTIPTSATAVTPAISATPVPLTATASPTIRVAPPQPTFTITRVPPTSTASPTLSPTPYPKSVIVNQDEQQMYIYENGVQVRVLPCSTGLPDNEETRTPAWEGTVGKYWGTFSSFGTTQDEGWFLFKHHGSILIHGAPYTLDEDGNKVYQDLDALGVRPISHGCIRLHPDDARWFTQWGPEGAHIVIMPWTGGSSQ
ncbi:MAG: L,D-transpeptidase family protein [Chloroflexi bacterium]|nr:L,D-transpeptidase family protein [Chloroflexota bacterium]